MPRPLRRAATLVAALAIAVVVHAAPPVPHRAATHPSPAQPVAAGAAARALPPAERPLELIESVPLGTSLGNPELRSAATVWMELVQHATTSLDFEEFYCSNLAGEPLQPILDAIVQAAKRGVKVRLLLDSKMHRTYPQPADSLGQIPGIHVRTIDFDRISGGVQHAKFFLVDGRIVVIGSQNMDWRSLEHIHELGVRIADERVADMIGRVFEMDWAMADVEAHSDSGTTIAWVPPAGAAAPPLPIDVVESRGDTVHVWPSWTPKTFSPDSTLWMRDAIVRSIDAARYEVVAQTLQYSPNDRRNPDAAIDQALRRAAGRGVQVKLIVSDWALGGPNMAPLESLSTVPNLEVKISQVPEWSGGYVPFARVEHCKYMVVDTTTTWLGTANWEPSYFHRVRNVAVTMRNRGIASQARRSFEASWTAPTAAPVHPGMALAARVHGETAPPGMKKVGD